MFNILKNIINYLLLLVILSGCKNTLSDNIIKKADKDCNFNKAQSCKIILQDVTTFNWDKVYFFGTWTMPDSIVHVIKTSYEGDYVPDDNVRTIFTYKNQLVYEEDLNMISFNNSIVDFPNMIDRLFHSKQFYLTPKTAIFKIKKERIEKGCDQCYIYNLIQDR